MVLEILSVFIIVQLVSPVYLYYVYDETPNVGFVVDSKNIGNKDIGIANKDSKLISNNNMDLSSYSIRDMYNVAGKYAGGKRFHSNARSSAHMVDTHFKVLKTSATTKVDNQRPLKLKDQDSPVEQIKFLDEPTGKDIEPRHYNARTANGFTPQNYARNDNVNSGLPHSKPYNKVNKDHDPYLINVHKTQITNKQKVKFNNNQFASVRRDESEVSPKSQQRSLEEIHMQAKSKYNQINQKKLDRRHYDVTDYKSIRDILAATIPTTAVNAKGAADTEKFKLNGRIGEIPRIGGWEESVDVKPYALFYRISQDLNKRQYGSMHHFINDDEDQEIKPEHMDEQTFQNGPSLPATSSPNAIKIRMKIKKYSNFRSH